MTEEILSKTLSEAVQAAKRLPAGSKVVGEIAFKAITPVMIGDFQGMHYRILHDIDNPEILSAWISGIPTAKAIIGKARWLTRVVIATALGLNDHSTAEKAGIKCKNEKIISLIGLLFGDAKNKGVITVRVEPLINYKLNEKIIIKNNKVSIKDYNNLRNEISIEKFYITHNNFDDFFKIFITHDNITYFIKSPNRFNAFLAQRKPAIYRLEKGNDSYSIIPIKHNSILHIEPINSNLIKFRLIILVDKRRLKKILEDCGYSSSEADEIIKKIIEFTILILASVPVLLGLGKASSKGFGRFNIIYNIFNLYEIPIIHFFNPIKNVIVLFELLVDIINKLKISINNYKKGKNTLIPKLSLKYQEHFCASYLSNIQPEGVIDIIARASSSKYNKYLDNFNNWVFGLPRDTKMSRLRKRRRQSLINPIIVEDNLNYILLNILFYSEDLYKVLGDKIECIDINTYKLLIYKAFRGFCEFLKELQGE